MTPIVLLHGFLGSPSDWDPLRGAWPRSEMISLPLPSARDWDSGIDKLCRQLPSKCVLVGYSMGARLALGCALSSEHQVDALFFMSGNPGLADHERQRRLKHDMRIAEKLESEAPETFLRSWYGQEVFSSLTIEQVDDLVARKAEYNAEYQAGLLRAFTVARQPDYWSQLPTTDLPIIAIAGERDPKYVAIVKRMEREASKCKSQIVTNAGHMVHREQPGVLTALLRKHI